MFTIVLPHHGISSIEPLSECINLTMIQFHLFSPSSTSSFTSSSSSSLLSYIGNRAFYHCEKLSTINLKETIIETIDDCAFIALRNLKAAAVIIILF